MKYHRAPIANAPRPGYLIALRAHYRAAPPVPSHPVVDIPFYYRPIRRSALRTPRYGMRYLHLQRSLARSCRARGFEKVLPGIWYDRVSDVVYIQTSKGVEPCAQITYRRAG